MKGTFPQYTNMIFTFNLFNASHEISINQGANLGVKNVYLRIQCLKCGGYGHIQAECANTRVMMSLKHAMRERKYAMNQWNQSIFLHRIVLERSNNF